MKHIFQRIRSSGGVQLIAKLSITVLVFWFVFHNVDFTGLQSVLKRQNHEILIVAGLLLFIQLVIGSYRWYLLVGSMVGPSENAISKGTALKIYYISTFFTCCLPGAVGGDVVRVWLSKSEHLSLPVSINSVIIDRIMALVALVIMVVVTMPILAGSAGFDATTVLIFVGIAAAIGIFVLLNADRILGPFKRFRVVNWALYLINSIRMIIKNPRVCVITLSLALIGQIIYAVSAWVLARSLYIDMSLTQSLTLMPPVMLATTLPISIGGWGVREVGIIGLLGLIGIPQASALVLSIQLGLLSVIVSLPGSMLWLAHRRGHAQQVVTP